MEFLILGSNVGGEICPSSAGGPCNGTGANFTCNYDNDCSGGAFIPVCICQGSRCTANCSTLWICGIGDVGMGPAGVQRA